RCPDHSFLLQLTLERSSAPLGSPGCGLFSGSFCLHFCWFLVHCPIGITFGKTLAPKQPYAERTPSSSASYLAHYITPFGQSQLIPGPPRSTTIKSLSAYRANKPWCQASFA